MEGYQMIKLVVSDMDGTLLMAEDIAEGVKFNYGKILYNQLPGLGIQITA